MGYQKYTLQENGDWIAIKSNSHKTDVLSCLIAGTFANDASLIETAAYQDVSGELGQAVPFVDGVATQIVLSSSQQYARSATDKDRWYILTVQNATGTTNIEILIASGVIKKSENVTVETV